MRGALSLVYLKICAREFNKVVLFIYYLFVLLCTKRARSSNGIDDIGEGFRTWVRIPGSPITSYYFSVSVQVCTQSQRITMHPQDSTFGSPDGQI